jgi:hypothetical protein
LLQGIQSDKGLVLPRPAIDVIQEFTRSLAGRKPSTVRLYVAGARAVIKAAGAGVLECGSRAELLSQIRKSQPLKTARVAPFLRFLEQAGGGAGKTGVSLRPGDIRGIQYWVVQAMTKRMRCDKNPSLATRRDLALIAALCCSSLARQEQANPLKWPKNCLQIQGSQVYLWDQKIKEPAFALSLRYWQLWRERLGRPDQARLYRKNPRWRQSELLFPGPRGGALGRAALHNALRRLSGVGEGSRGRLTPGKIRVAFLCGGDPLTTRGGDAVPPL